MKAIKSLICAIVFVLMAVSFAACDNNSVPFEPQHTHGLGCFQWTTMLAPTCTDDGEEVRICTNDNSQIETRTLSALGHNFVYPQSPPNDTLIIGEDIHVSTIICPCSRCDETKTEYVYISNVTVFPSTKIAITKDDIGGNVESIAISANIATIESGAFLDWTADKIIYVEGFSNQEEADAAWGENWRQGCNATIVYLGTTH